MNSTALYNIDSLNKLEYYATPFLVVFGIVGNLLGSICIFSNHKMSKRTPLFMLATIGISDSVMLILQLERWFAIHYENFLIVSSSACKFYFTLLHLSILVSSSLTFLLVLLRFVSLFMGNYHLSTYSNIGQMLSKLSVAYVLALSLSLSWHHLWSSEITKDNMPIHLSPNSQFDHTHSITPSNDYKQSKASNSSSELLCSKRLNDSKYELFNVVEAIYFGMAAFLNICLIFLPFLVSIKLYAKKSRFNEFQRNICRGTNQDILNNQPSISVNEITQNNQESVSDTENLKPSTATAALVRPSTAKSQKKIRYSVPNITFSRSSNFENACEEIHTRERCMSLWRISEAKNISSTSVVVGKVVTIAADTNANEENFDSDLTSRRCTFNYNSRLSTVVAHRKSTLFILARMQQPKQFTRFIIIISIFCGFLSLPYLVVDFFFYKDALLSEILTNKFELLTTDYPKYVLQMPITLISIPHSIKFYLLFVFYSKFRSQIGCILKCRLYVNKRLAKKLSNSGKNNKSIKFIMIYHFNMLICCLNKFQGEYEDEVFSNQAWLRRFIVKFCLKWCFKTSRQFSKPVTNFNKQHIHKILTKMKNDDFADETSSIAGFQAGANNESLNLNDMSLWNLYEPVLAKASSDMSVKRKSESNAVGLAPSNNYSTSQDIKRNISFDKSYQIMVSLSANEV